MLCLLVGFVCFLKIVILKRHLCCMILIVIFQAQPIFRMSSAAQKRKNSGGGTTAARSSKVQRSSSDGSLSLTDSTTVTDGGNPVAGKIFEEWLSLTLHTMKFQEFIMFSSWFDVNRTCQRLKAGPGAKTKTCQDRSFGEAHHHREVFSDGLRIQGG